MEECIFWQSIEYSTQNFDIFCPSGPVMLHIWAKLKLVKFHRHFSWYNFEKLIWTLSGERSDSTFWYFKNHPLVQIGLSESQKLHLNLCSYKWLGPMQRQVRKISPFAWLTLKTSLLRGLIKFKIFFLKVEYKGATNIWI